MLKPFSFVSVPLSLAISVSSTKNKKRNQQSLSVLANKRFNLVSYSMLQRFLVFIVKRGTIKVLVSPTSYQEAGRKQTKNAFWKVRIE